MRVLSRLFRRLFLERLAAAHAKGDLSFFGDLAPLADPSAFTAYLAPLRRCEWVVFAKRPFGGPAAVLAYLARYTHRVAISNSRLIALDERGVTFSWKDYRAKSAAAGNGWIKTMTLPADEFLRRFLLHVLPDGFHRIRHYGLLASGQRAANVRRARELIGPAQDSDPPAAASPAAAPTVVDPALAMDPPCPCCGGRMRIIETFLRGHAPRTVTPTPIRIDTS